MPASQASEDMQNGLLIQIQADYPESLCVRQASNCALLGSQI
jgi:hypothetical protein